MRRVYLDNNATTRVDPRVLEVMSPHFLQDFGNASSIHEFGQQAREAVETARQAVADLVGSLPKEIIFTSGGTESDNTAIRGIAASHTGNGRHLITTTIEHPAVLRTMEQLEEEGFRVTYLPVDRQGLIRLKDLHAAVREDTILISIMHANNETGAIQELRAVGRFAREKGILFHTDAVQSAGKIPVDVNDLGVDLLSLSGHKIHGPKGVGALYLRHGVQMKSLLLGGSHERGRRGGTENVPGIVALGKAVALAREGLADFDLRVRSLRDRIETGLLERIPQTRINGSTLRRMPHTTNLSFRGVEGEALLISLDLQGIAVSTGAACSSGSLEPSHVLKAMGFRNRRVESALRLSLSRMTTEEEITTALEVLPRTIRRMRELSPLYRESRDRVQREGQRAHS